jgi:hypothetical protein
MKWILGIFLSMVIFAAIYGTATEPDFWKKVNEARIEREAAQAALPPDNTGLYVDCLQSFCDINNGVPINR